VHLKNDNSAKTNVALDPADSDFSAAGEAKHLFAGRARHSVSEDAS
jgi:hypothetical protein